MPYDAVEIKSRTSISQVLREHGVALSRAGSELRARCPFHREKSPSFSVNEGKGVYVCFGCGRRGDVVSFVQQYREVSFVEALAYLAQRTGAQETRADFGRVAAPEPREVSRPAGVAELWSRCVGVGHDRGVVAWLRARGLDPRLVEEHDLARTLPVGKLPRWIPPEWPQRGGYRLVVPVFDESGALATVRVRSVFRRADPKTRAVLGHTQGQAVIVDRLGRWLLTGSDRARSVVRRVGLYVAEGEPDFLTLATMTPERAWKPRRRGDGHPAVFGIFQTAWCDEIARRIPEGTAVTIWPHRDPAREGDLGAGYRYAHQVRESLQRCGLRDEQIRWVELTKATDVNELHLMALERGRPPRVRSVAMSEAA